MSSADDTAAPDIVIFGAAGDLSCRKLLPALYMAHMHSRLEPGTRILAIGRQAWSRQQYLDFIDARSPAFIEPAAMDASVWGAFLARLDYIGLDVSDAGAYAALAQRQLSQGLRVFYLATAPSLFARICEHLGSAGLIHEGSRVVLEKPLGTDLASAQAINTAVARHFREDQIYRIDHYLGKETVQNLMVLRFGNAIFEPLWRAPFIKSVQITVAETAPALPRASRCSPTCKKRACPRAAGPRPLWLCAPTSTTRAGPMCRFFCARASVWPSAIRKSSLNFPSSPFQFLAAAPITGPTGSSSACSRKSPSI
jgi:glucose-6-phosphate 1-dehydrogenase